MMGGGVCWLDYNNDGWLDLFAVNTYSDSTVRAVVGARRRCRPAPCSDNVHGRFVNVTKSTHTDLPVQGEGCVAADFDGDGLHRSLSSRRRPTTCCFWNNGDGTFTEGARKAGVVSFGWHSGAAVADVNGDGRPDLFVAGYTNTDAPIQNSVKGFPSNYAGVRDELFLNEGHRHFREVAAAGRARPEAVRPQPRRRVHRRERRRPPRPLRRERRGSEPPLPERARRAARLPLRRRREDRRASPTRTPAWASLRPT